MKNFIRTGLLSAILLGCSSVTGMAAVNPFTDVPSDHWAYQALVKLNQDGIVTGYEDASFRGGQPVKRYEMAKMVGSAMAMQEQMSQENKELVDKLSHEFSAELENLGVRVSELEKKTDNVRFDGFFRLRTEKFGGEGNSIDNTTKAYFEIYTTADVGNGWQAKAKTKLTSDMKKDSNSTESEMTNKYMQGRIGATDIKLGVFDTVDGYAYTHEDPMKGVQVSFGDKLKTRLSIGNINNPNNNFSAGGYGAAEFTYKLNKATNITAAQHWFRSVESGYKAIADDNFGISNIGFDTVFAKNLRFVGLYSRSTAESATNKNGYFTELDYKRMDIKDPGSFMVMLRNFRVTDATAISSRYEAYSHGNVQGTEIGVCYAPIKNVEAGLKYFWGEDTQTKNDRTFLRGEIKYFF